MNVKKAAATLAAIFAAPASAALIVVDPTHFADDAVKQNLVLFDDVSNLFWHKLTPTIGLTHEFATSQFGEGGQFEGMRVASLDEVRDMFEQAGLPVVGPGFGPTLTTPEQLAAANDLQSIFGFYTQGRTNPVYITNGMTSTNIWPDMQAAAAIVTGAQNFTRLGAVSLSPVMEFNDVGHWLVHEGTYTLPSNDNGGGVGQVPEPGTLALVLLTATGAVAMRRRRHAS